MEKFRLHLLRKGIKKSTINGHIDTVSRVLSKTSIDKFDSHILNLLDRNCKPSYVNNIVKSMRVYGDYINNDNLKKIPYMKQEDSEKGIMSDSEINAFIKLPPNGVYGVYLTQYKINTLFWKCLAFSGARTSEIANLTINDCDFGRGLFLVDGKTGKRSIPIAPILVTPLTEHIKTLKSKYLFPSMRTGKPIERATWHYDFCQRLKRIGIKRKGLTPYSLRHSYITRMLDEVNIFKVQKIVGHRRITTTEKYTHLTTKDVIKTITRDPLGRAVMTYEERFKLFRSGVLQLLSDCALTVAEEKKMIKNLCETISTYLNNE